VITAFGCLDEWDETSHLGLTGIFATLQSALLLQPHHSNVNGLISPQAPVIIIHLWLTFLKLG
jgi:hypothetical protein